MATALTATRLRPGAHHAKHCVRGGGRGTRGFDRVDKKILTREEFQDFLPTRFHSEFPLLVNPEWPNSSPNSLSHPSKLLSL